MNVEINPMTFSTEVRYIIVIDLNNSNSRGSFGHTASITYDSDVISYHTGGYNNTNHNAYPGQTGGT